MFQQFFLQPTHFLLGKLQKRGERITVEKVRLQKVILQTEHQDTNHLLLTKGTLL